MNDEVYLISYWNKNPVSIIKFFIIKKKDGSWIIDKSKPHSIFWSKDKESRRIPETIIKLNSGFRSKNIIRSDKELIKKILIGNI